MSSHGTAGQKPATALVTTGLDKQPTCIRAKAPSTEDEVRQIGLKLKLKNCHSVKDDVRRMKRQETDLEKTFAYHKALS